MNITTINTSTTSSTNTNSTEWGYQSSKTINPGWPMTISVIVLCGIWNFILIPLCIRYKRKQQQQQQQQQQRNQPQQSQSQLQLQPPLETLSKDKKEKNHHDNNNNDNENDDDALSILSGMSFASSVASKIIEGVVELQSHSHYHHRTTRPKRQRRRLPRQRQPQQQPQHGHWNSQEEEKEEEQVYNTRPNHYTTKSTSTFIPNSPTPYCRHDDTSFQNENKDQSILHDENGSSISSINTTNTSKKNTNRNDNNTTKKGTLLDKNDHTKNHEKLIAPPAAHDTTTTTTTKVSSRFETAISSLWKPFFGFPLRPPKNTAPPSPTTHTTTNSIKKKEDDSNHNSIDHEDGRRKKDVLVNDNVSFSYCGSSIQSLPDDDDDDDDDNATESVISNMEAQQQQQHPKPQQPNMTTTTTTTTTTLLNYSLLDIVYWDHELKKLAGLCVPYCIQGCTESLFMTINVAILGNFVGVEQANTYVVVTILLEFTATFTYGFREAIGTLGPQADGAGNDLLMGRYLQLSIIFFLLSSIPGFVIWSFLAYDTILWFGFDENAATLGQAYAYPFLLVVTFSGIDDCLHMFMDIIDHEAYATVWGILAGLLETCMIIIMATVIGCKDLVWIGYAQAILKLVILIANLSIILYLGWMDDYWQGFAKTFSLRDTKAVRTMLITAIPLGISWILVYGEWEVLTVFAGYMGGPEVATWGILGFVWDTFEQITRGMSAAAEVRVGYRMGSGEPNVAKLVSYKSIYLGAIVASFATSFLFILSPYLPRWLTPDPTQQYLLFALLPLMGFGQIVMVVGSVCWNILAAQGRTHLATTIEFMTSWFFVVPVSAITVYIFNFNLLTLQAAIVLGYSIAGGICSFLVMTADWTAHSDIVKARNATEGALYEEHDWDDLPPHIREAAIVLGFNQELWDSGKESNLCDVAWDDLNSEAQEAARILGYNRKKWDKEEDTSSSSNSLMAGVDWDDLPPVIQNAAETIGYNRETWDSGQRPAIAKKGWGSLTGTEQDAAILLGYDPSSWCGQITQLDESKSNSPPNTDYDGNELPDHLEDAAQVIGYNKMKWDYDQTSPSQCWEESTTQERKADETIGYNNGAILNDADSESSSSLHPNYAEMSWNELPGNIQEVVNRLGLNKTTWEHNMIPSFNKKHWVKLTYEERKAAINFFIYDHNMLNWNDGSISLNVNFDDTLWKHLPDSAKIAATILGYNEAMWDSGKLAPIEEKDWDELTPLEQRSARKLGYCEEKWKLTRQYSA